MLFNKKHKPRNKKIISLNALPSQEVNIPTITADTSHTVFWFPSLTRYSFPLPEAGDTLHITTHHQFPKKTTLSLSTQDLSKLTRLPIQTPSLITTIITNLQPYLRLSEIHYKTRQNQTLTWWQEKNTTLFKDSLKI